MKRLVAAAVIAGTIGPAIRLGAQAQGQEAPLDPKVIKWDKGPDRIDVSRYPADMKEKYRLVEALCSKCHTLARAVNCDFVLEDDWERYIKKMMRRGKGVIDSKDAMQIYEFLVYDSKTRKKALYDQKLAGIGK